MKDLGIRVRGPFSQNACWNFPDAGWRDFVAVVVNWWLAALKELGRVGTCALKFMDGPYEIRVMRDRANVQIQFVARSTHGEVVERISMIAYERLVSVVIRACESATTALLNARHEAEAEKLSGALTSFVASYGL